MKDGMDKSLSFHLGRKTIAALVAHLECSTLAKLEHLLFKHRLNARFSGTSKLAALGNVFYPLVKDGADEDEVRLGRELVEELAQDWFATIKAHDEDEFRVSEQCYQHALQTYQRFQQALRADGFDLIEGKVTPFLSTSVDPAKEQGLLETRLVNLGFSESKSHLDQAINNSASGNWAAANSQVRSFLESLCEAIARRVFPGNGTPPVRGDARKYLAKNSFFSPEESELLRAFFQVLHGAGGHSGTSDEDDCHRRRLMAVAMANYYLDQLRRLGQ